ncbi:MAG: hypothetical protein QME05_04330, partial [Candidatus Margulisbacteria bacterium]|nr:hypothetical protein [Candidatus Margulisiibacteriota bacterium]
MDNQRGNNLLSWLFIVLLILAATAGSAFAAAYTWDGGGANNNWSTTGNWSPDGTPGASDTVAFDGTSTKNSIIDASFAGSVAGISINAGYVGEITQSRSLTIGSSHFSQAAGTFTGGSAAIDLNGGFTLSSGTFTSTSGNLNVSGAWTHTAGGTFNHNNGTVISDGGNQTFDFDSTLSGGNSGTFYNFQRKASSTATTLTISSGDTLVVQNNLTLNDGLISTGSINVSGNVTITSNYDGGTSPLNFLGSGTQTFDLTGATGTYNGNITIGDATHSPTVNLASDCILDAAGQDLTITNGSINIGAYELEVKDDLTVSGG